MQKFKQLVDVLMRHHLSYPELTVLGKQVDHNILSIEFGENLLAIRKKTAEQAAHAPVVPSSPVQIDRVRAWQKRAQATNSW